MMEEDMKAIINNKEYDLTMEELDFVKNMFGAWEVRGDVHYFRREEFLTISELSEKLGITKQAIWVANQRYPDRKPLHKKNGFGYIWESELKYWTK